MDRFQHLHERMNTLGHVIYAPLIFMKLDDADKGDVTLNYSNVTDLGDILSGLVSDLESKKSK